MRRWLVLSLSVFLPTCDTPGRGFTGIPATLITVDGATFAIWQRTNYAEALRTSNHAFPRYDWVVHRGAIAIRRVSGCQVSWIVGDPSVLHAGLTCNGDKAPKIPKGPKVFECDTTLQKPIGALQEGTMMCSG